MSLSAKWTAVTLFTLTALGAGGLAAGCTVTSGDPDNREGGVGNPPPNEASTPADTSVVDGGGGNACPNNTQQTSKFPAACQAATESECCPQLVACFGATIDKTDAAAPQADCNVHKLCFENCFKKVDGSPETDLQKIKDCQEQICDPNAPQNVRDAYDAVLDCQTTKQKANDACQ